MIYPNFTIAHQDLLRQFKRAPIVHPQRWQGVDVSQRPEAKMVELLHPSFQVAMQHENLAGYREDLSMANYPWVDNHFQERVCGAPINPGTEWANWPWGNSADAHREENGQFNHNYMERYWPKHAGQLNAATQTKADWDAGFDELDRDEWNTGDTDAIRGIRYPYGDLSDMVQHLQNEPDTRQAYLPIFYPEDTGTMNPTRKPCTLGYHFILRHGYFHVTYYMRSCDFRRHWADDCYLTIRLQLWILNQLRAADPETWDTVRPGFFTMHVTSLHMFTNDLRELTT